MKTTHALIASTLVTLSLADQAIARPPGSSSTPMRVRVDSAKRGGLVVTLEFLDGYHPNPRVPASKRLVLTSGARTWSTPDFDVRRTSATLDLPKDASTPGELTAYLCRKDRCTRLSVPVRLED